MLKLLNEKELETDQIPVHPEALYKLTEIIAEGKISITAGQEVFREMFYTGKSAEEIVKEKGLGQISDTADLERIINNVLDISKIESGARSITQENKNNNLNINKSGKTEG